MAETSVTRAPSRAATREVNRPAAPAPTTTRSAIAAYGIGGARAALVPPSRLARARRAGAPGASRAHHRPRARHGGQRLVRLGAAGVPGRDARATRGGASAGARRLH